MKKIIITLLFALPVVGNSQLFVRNDSLFRIDPATGNEIFQPIRHLRPLRLSDTPYLDSRFLKTSIAAELYQLKGNYLTQNDVINLTGPVSGSGRNTINTVISNGAITNSMLEGNIAFSKLIGSDITITQNQVTGLSGALALKAPLASPVFTAPTLGDATGTSFLASGQIKSSGTGGIGYSAGAGGTVTQATNKSTGVTLNKITGEITMMNSALAAAAIVSFTLTNSTIAATDVIILNHVTTGTRGAYGLNAQCANGSAVFYIRNNSAASLSEAIVIRFVVIKAVTN